MSTSSRNFAAPRFTERKQNFVRIQRPGSGPPPWRAESISWRGLTCSAAPAQIQFPSVNESPHRPQVASATTGKKRLMLDRSMRSHQFRSHQFRSHRMTSRRSDNRLEAHAVSHGLNGWQWTWILLSLIYLAICIGFAVFFSSASLPPPDLRVVIVITLMCWSTPVAVIYALGRGVALVTRGLTRPRSQRQSR